ncbi:MAG: transcriptional regulator [Oscillospiraceae bacterium]|nr:transcriptional regulator [Oscillospiraceae bacterium]
MAREIESRYYTCQDVMLMLGCGRGKAYSIIKQLNNEQRGKGYITIPGKVNKDFFESKLYGNKR